MAYRRLLAGDHSGWYLAPSEATSRAGDALIRGWDGADWTEYVALATDHPVWPPLGWAFRHTGMIPRQRTQPLA